VGNNHPGLTTSPRPNEIARPPSLAAAQDEASKSLRAQNEGKLFLRNLDYLNRLFYGDNLNVLREHIRNESVDLIYLDPPF
jgi:hypothetical protein